MLILSSPYQINFLKYFSHSFILYTAANKVPFWDFTTTTTTKATKTVSFLLGMAILRRKKMNFDKEQSFV